MNQLILSCHNLSKAYRKRQVLRNVALELYSGEVVGLLGANGAGKTTCFQIIIGLQQGFSGTLKLLGKDITRLNLTQRVSRGLGYLPQEATIFRGLTVSDNIRMALEMRGMRIRDSAKAAREILEEFHLDHLSKQRASTLSGGERRRTEIARLIATRPAAMLLDEPFAGVDPIAIAELQQLVHSMKARGIGVLITDHQVRETLKICDRGYILSDGKVCATGTPQEIIANDKARRAYLGNDFTL